MTEAEVQTIYECLEEDQIVSPIHFSNEIDRSRSLRKLAYSKMDEMLEETGPQNPYEFMMMNPNQSPPMPPRKTDDYYVMTNMRNKPSNTQDMEDWSILSTEIHYAHQNLHNGKSLMVLDGQQKILEEWITSSTAPTLAPINLPEDPVVKEYMDQYDSITHKLHDTTSFHDNRDVSTTYLGKEIITQEDVFTPELKIPISTDSHTIGQVVGGSLLKILIDTGASKSYMSRAYYMRNKNLHSLPKFETHIRSLQVGNGGKVATLFVIPVLVEIKGHRFEIFTLVAEIEEHIDLVFGMKNMHEVEGEHSARHSEFRFLNRAIPMFPTNNFTLKPGCKRYVKVIAPFPQQLSGIAIMKIIQGSRALTVQCKIQKNLGVLDIINTSETPIVFSKNIAIGIVDIRSLGFFNIRHCTLQYNLSVQLPQFNRMINRHASRPRPKQTCKAASHAKHARSAEPDQYPWLDSKDSRRTMTDEQILCKYIDLSESTLDEHGKAVLMDIILEHKQAFSLRDEIGECPNIKIDIDVIDDSPFFVRPFPISEEDKPIMDWQMQRLVSLGILTRNTTSHTSPVMLITRKITKGQETCCRLQATQHQNKKA